MQLKQAGEQHWPMTRRLAAVGIVVTLVYAGGIGWLLWGRAAELLTLAPNNLGDFLAGVFGPLAVLWLVLGYFQQGIELRQNVEALRLQAAELKNSVEQQTQLVQVSRAQLNAALSGLQEGRERHIAARRATFVFSRTTPHWASTGDQNSHPFTLVNTGATASTVRIEVAPRFPGTIHFDRVQTFATNDSHEVHVELKPKAEQGDIIAVRYVDGSGDEGEQEFVTARDADGILRIAVRPFPGNTR
jgi:Tfp pilus assembly protein PilE